MADDKPEKFRDKKTGRFTTKEKYVEAQKAAASLAQEEEKMRKADREGLNIIKEQNQLLRDQTDLRREAKSLSKQILNDWNEQTVREEEGLTHPRSKIDLAAKLLKARTRIKDIDYEILAAEKEGDDVSRGILIEAKANQEKMIGRLKAEDDARDKINDKMGSMHSIMRGLEDIPFARHFYDGEAAILEMEKAVHNGDKAWRGLFTSVKKNIKDNIEGLIKLGGAGAMKGLYDTMVSVNKETTAFSKDLGLSNSEASDLRTKMSDIAIGSGKTHLTTLDMTKSMNTLNSQFGTASTIIREDIVSEMANLAKTTEMSAEAQGRFASMAMRTGINAREITHQARQAVVEAESEMGVRLKITEVLEEAGKVTGVMAANMGYNVIAISKAIGVAKQFGMTLADVANTSSKLLDFNSSIDAELQAELYTGKQLNLEKARLLALTGDYEGLSREINDNLADEYEWTNMNVLAKEKMAAALGMSSDQMSDIIYKQSNFADLAQDARDMGKEDLAQSLEKRDMQQRMNDLMEKAASIAVDYLAPALDKVANMMAWMADSAGAVSIAVGIFAAVKLGGMIASLAAMALQLGIITKAQLLSSALTNYGIGIAIAIAAVAAGVSAFNAMSGPGESESIEDGAIDPDGGLVVSGKKGTIQIDKEDSLVAGTNLYGNNNSPIQGINQIEVIKGTNEGESNRKTVRDYEAKSLDLLERIKDATLAAGLGVPGVLVYSAFDATKADKHYETKYR